MQIDQLCSRLKTGDQSAFNEVVQLFGEKFKAQVRRMLSKYPGVRRWEETDDVYQTLLIKLHRSLSEVNVSSPAEIFAIASTQIRRTLIDLARHYFGKRGVGRNHFSDDQNLQPDGNPQINQKESPSSEPESIEQWSEFHSAVESLETDQKEVFQLIWYASLTQKEIATMLNVSERTVLRRLNRARLALSEQI